MLQGYIKRAVQCTVILGALCTATAGGISEPAHAAGWQVAAFANSSVSVIEVNQRNPREMAAIVGGALHLSHDAGSTWVPSLLPVPARTLAYDMVYSGRLYTGTGSGLYVSDNAGMTWRLFGASITNRKIVTALQVTEEYVFAAMYDGGSSPVRVWRLGSSGEAQDMNLPSANTAAFDYDFGTRQLYVGAAGGVYQSSNQGTSWSGGGQGAGQFTLDLAIKPGLIWQLSADGLFRSNDNGASWNKLAGPGNINGTFYGNSMHLSGLGVSGNRAFYGAWSIGFPYRFLVEYDGSGARSLLNAKVASVAISGNRVWAASDAGLWVSDVLSLNQPRVQRPVLLIPGILGSMPTTASLAAQLERTFLGTWDDSYQTPFVLDPIHHTYDGLITALEKQGFVVNNTLFAFPYNWLQDNVKTATQLSQKLHDIRQICKCTQIDIVAHSMGGLVARSYINSDHYQNDVRNLIMLGTPNAGSVAAYEVWEGGALGKLKPDNRNKFLSLIARALSDPAVESPRAEALRAIIPSIGQLLPVTNYLSGRFYPNGYPRNLFLEHLNVPAEIVRLKDRVALYVVGSKSRITPQALTVSDVDLGANVWPHGSILSASYGSGDDTVLQSSLEAVAKSSLLLDAGHLQLVSAAAPFIVQTLMGEYVPDISIPLWPSQRFLAVYASGPVALSITSPRGQIVDDASIAVPGAYYSGSSHKPQLAIIPMDQVEDYAISVRATGGGMYRIGVEEIAAPVTGEHDVPSIMADEQVASDDVSTIIPGEKRRYTYKGSTGNLDQLNKSASENRKELGSHGSPNNTITPLSREFIFDNPTDISVVNLTKQAQISAVSPERPFLNAPHPAANSSQRIINRRFLLVAVSIIIICVLLIRVVIKWC